MTGNFQCVGKRGGLRPSCQPIARCSFGAVGVSCVASPPLECARVHTAGQVDGSEWPRHTRGRAPLLCHAAHMQAVEIQPMVPQCEAAVAAAVLLLSCCCCLQLWQVTSVCLSGAVLPYAGWPRSLHIEKEAFCPCTGRNAPKAIM